MDWDVEKVSVDSNNRTVAHYSHSIEQLRWRPVKQLEWRIVRHVEVSL